MLEFCSYGFVVALSPSLIDSRVADSIVSVTITNSVAQEHEGSSPHSQQLATGPYPEPVESNPQFLS
jgi:hypothetical protein